MDIKNLTPPEKFSLLATKGALYLETKGLKHSRGSVYQYVKTLFKLKGNKQSVYDQFVKLLEDNGVIAPKKIIYKELMEHAAKLSSEWNNTGFIVLNGDGSLSTTVWNHYQYENPKRKYVATVNGNEGFKIKNTDYKFEVEPSEIIN